MQPTVKHFAKGSDNGAEEAAGAVKHMVKALARAARAAGYESIEAQLLSFSGGKCFVALLTLHGVPQGGVLDWADAAARAAAIDAWQADSKDMLSAGRLLGDLLLDRDSEWCYSVRGDASLKHHLWAGCQPSARCVLKGELGGQHVAQGIPMLCKKCKADAKHQGSLLAYQVMTGRKSPVAAAPEAAASTAACSGAAGSQRPDSAAAVASGVARLPAAPAASAASRPRSGGTQAASSTAPERHAGTRDTVFVTASGAKYHTYRGCSGAEEGFLSVADLPSKYKAVKGGLCSFCAKGQPRMKKG